MDWASLPLLIVPAAYQLIKTWIKAIGGWKARDPVAAVV
jgi:hypothetical protein